MSATEANWEVILRNQSLQVMYQHSNNQMQIISNQETTCTLCGQKRPFESVNQYEVHSSYFRLLQTRVTHIPSLPAEPVFNVHPGLDAGSFNQGYYDCFFVELKKIGRGQRGSVFLCKHVLDRVVLGNFAVKAIPVGASHEWLARMLKEVNLLESLRHPNVIEYKHAWLEMRKLHTFAPNCPCLFILMELANGGNLEEYLQLQNEPMAYSSTYAPPEAKRHMLRRRSRGNERFNDEFKGPSTLTTSVDGSSVVEDYVLKHGGIGMGLNGKKVRFLTLPVIISLFTDILKGIKHLHTHGIIHRDLKPPNLLLRFDLSETSNCVPTILISDFGECEVLDEVESQRVRTGATGTLEFMPPVIFT